MNSSHTTLPGVRAGTVPVMAVACGVMVANIYLCQPILGQIARELGVPERLTALVAVASQIGYALGILLVVPLADVAEPKKLVRVLFAVTAFSLLAAASSFSVFFLIAMSVAIAATSVIAQILIPLSTNLVAPENRGRIVGALMSGLILGILLARTASGILAQYSGTWRAPYFVSAALVAGMFFVVPPFVPGGPAGKAKTSYAMLLGSLPKLLHHRPLLLSMGIQFCVFGSFSAFWATLAFHLESPAFHLGPAAAGLFGVWGAPGALLAPVAGRVADRWGSNRVNAAALVALGISFALAAIWGRSSLLGLVLAVNLLDFGVQSGQVANQTRIFGIGEAIRGRLNTLYMVATFSGGALGAFAGSAAWTYAGWMGVCGLGAGLITVAAVILGMTTVIPNFFKTATVGSSE